jgi:hypothetical protein
MLNTYPCKHTERCGVSPPFVDHFPVSPPFFPHLFVGFTLGCATKKIRMNILRNPRYPRDQHGSALCKSLAMLLPISRPYAPVSSEVSQISVTPSWQIPAPFPTNDGDWSWLVNVLIQDHSTSGERISSKYLNTMLKKETAILNSMLPSL